MKTCSYVWDLNNPNEPEVALNSPSPITNLCFNHKLTDTIGGGCANGIVGIWDARKGKDPVALSHVEKSHSDPVTHFQWQMTKTGQECVTVSTDGYAHFWDIRKLKEDRVESLAIKDFDSNGQEIQIGATTLENSPEAATKYIIGTEQGTLVIANKKPKKPVEISTRLGHNEKHLGPIYSIARNLQFPKVFMTMGDWSAKLWMDDLKTPLIKTKYHDSYISDGCFSPTRIGAFFLTRKDGWLDVWDYYYRQNEVAFSHKVSTAPLTSIKINYSGSGNQITGGKVAAIGDEDGTVTILELCESLYTMQKNERDIMTDIFTREMTKEKNLEALRRLQEMEKKRVPKDTAAIQKKIEERKAEEIAKVEERFAALLGEVSKQEPPKMEEPDNKDKEDDKKE